MVAGSAAMKLLTEGEIDRINDLGHRLRVGVRQAAVDHGAAVTVTGMGSMAQVHFTAGPVVDYASAAAADKARAAALHLALINEGVFTSPTCRFAVSTPMTAADVDAAVSAAGRAFTALRQPRAA
jgi:glutamate-1-semialdehyde 2,1-aminomutase